MPRSADRLRSSGKRPRAARPTNEGDHDAESICCTTSTRRRGWPEPFMSVLRVEHVGIVLDDLAAAPAFFAALGLSNWRGEASAGLAGGDLVPGEAAAVEGDNRRRRPRGLRGVALDARRRGRPAGGALRAARPRLPPLRRARRAAATGRSRARRGLGRRRRCRRPSRARPGGVGRQLRRRAVVGHGGRSGPDARDPGARGCAGVSVSLPRFSEVKDESERSVDVPQLVGCDTARGIAEASWIDRCCLLGQHPCRSPVDLDLGSKACGTRRRGGRSYQPCRERKLIGLDNDGVAGISLLVSVGAARCAQPVHLTTHVRSPCPAASVPLPRGPADRWPTLPLRHEASIGHVRELHRSRPLARQSIRICHRESARPAPAPRLHQDEM